jgi:hypothetical protein
VRRRVNSKRWAARDGMTTQVLLLMIGGYSAALVVVAYLTRATGRRIEGAVVGGACVGIVVLAVLWVLETLGWCHIGITWTPAFLLLLYVLSIVWCASMYLLTWRVARRFGWVGLAMVVCVAGVLGPVHDLWAAARFPEWITIGPGVWPVMAIAATYIAEIVVGHAVMRLVAGASGADRLRGGP